MACMLFSYIMFIVAFVLNLVNCTVATPKETLECPTNESLWMQRSADVCNNSQEYHCLPTIFLNESVELCITVISIQPGFCPVYNPYLKKVYIDINSRCAGKPNFSGCPKDFYNSNESYRYQSCQRINPVKSCYLADFSCPNFKSNDPSDPTNTMDTTIPTACPGGEAISDAQSLSPLMWIYLLMCGLALKNLLLKQPL